MRVKNSFRFMSASLGRGVRRHIGGGDDSKVVLANDSP
jgi:hypothetical protein